jgi:hypothetical protein
LLAPCGVNTRSHRHCHSICGASADIFERDHHEPSKNSSPLEGDVCEGRPLRCVRLSSPDRLLKQANDDPWIGGKWVKFSAMIPADILHKPSSNVGKRVAHYVPNHLMIEKL